MLNFAVLTILRLHWWDSYVVNLDTFDLGPVVFITVECVLVLNPFVFLKPVLDNSSHVISIEAILKIGIFQWIKKTSPLESVHHIPN